MTWRDQAACAAHPDDLWNAAPGDAEASAAARAICRACAVQADCLSDALARREHFGVLGGFTGSQRRVIAGTLAVFGVPIASVRDSSVPGGQP